MRISDEPRPFVVLVVDDEPYIREMLVKGLAAFGLDARAAPGGAEAVELLRLHPGEVGAALIDLLMPRMTGWETLAALKALKPSLPCCVMTSFDDSGEGAGAADAFLQKPFSLREAAELLRGLMGEGA